MDEILFDAEKLGDVADGIYVVDFVPLHESGSGQMVRLPVPGQQSVEPRCGMSGDAAEDIGEPRLGGDVVHPGGDNQAVHDGAEHSAVVASIVETAKYHRVYLMTYLADMITLIVAYCRRPPTEQNRRSIPVSLHEWPYPSHDLKTALTGNPLACF